MYDFSDTTWKFLRFIIISDNKEKIEETTLNILSMFKIYQDKGIKIVEDLQEQKNDVGLPRNVKFYIAKDYYVDISIFSGIKSVKGQRTHFVFIDKDIDIEEYDVDDIILPMTVINDCTDLFTNRKGYISI